MMNQRMMSKYNAAKIIKRSLYVIVILFIVGYALYNSRIFIAGPQIEITNPQNGATISENPLIYITGQAFNISFINLNDKPINVDEKSIFNEPVLLYPGYNIVTIKATDKFQRQVEKTIELVFKENTNGENRPILIDNLEEQNATSTATTTSSSTLEEV